MDIVKSITKISTLIPSGFGMRWINEETPSTKSMLKILTRILCNILYLNSTHIIN